MRKSGLKTRHMAKKPGLKYRKATPAETARISSPKKDDVNSVGRNYNRKRQVKIGTALKITRKKK